MKLDLNDGWTQIPPKEDGEYWYACAKPWRTDFINCHSLMRIKNGVCVSRSDNTESVWTNPDSEKVWDYTEQINLIAAWRLRNDGEQSAPDVAGAIERHPVRCPNCDGLSAIYRVKDGNPLVCYHCGHTKVIMDFYSIARMCDV